MSELKKVVSVCMITYNHNAFISQAIEGVMMQQTTFPIELIIGEDCSMDNTRKICKEYNLKYPDKIKLLMPKSNLGMMQNFINTLQACKGKYIALCEGDDYWIDPYKLQKQVDFLEVNTNFSLCFHNAEIIYQNSNKPHSLFQCYDKSVYTAKENICKWIIPTASVLFRNVMLDNSLPAYFDKVVHGDFALFMWIGEFGNFYCIDEIMCVYRKHESSIMTELNNVNSLYKIIGQYFEMKKYFGKKYKYEFNKKISSLYLDVTSRQIKNEEYFLMISSIMKALKYDPIVFFRNKNKAEYLGYYTFKILFSSFFLSVYKKQIFIRRSKLKKLLKWNQK